MNTIIASELKLVLDPYYVTFEKITDHERKFLVAVLMNLLNNNYDHLFNLLSTFIQIQEFASNGGAPVAKQIIKELETLEAKGEIDFIDSQFLERVGEFTDENGVHYELIVGEEKLSFFRLMLEEKGLDNETIEVEHEDNLHIIDMDRIIDLMECTTKDEQKTIEETMRKIDFLNGDMMHYMKHLATGYVVTHY